MKFLLSIILILFSSSFLTAYEVCPSHFKTWGSVKVKESPIQEVEVMQEEPKFWNTMEITFDKACREEALALQDHLITFYSQELFNAGLFQDEASALVAAKEEVLQETVKSYYFYLTSDQFEKKRFGYIAYSINGQTAYIENIYLNQEYRGIGLGKVVLNALELELEKKNCDTIKLYVFAHNHAAISLYKKMGYLVENTYLNNQSPVGFHMKKVLIPRGENTNQ